MPCSAGYLPLRLHVLLAIEPTEVPDAASTLRPSYLLQLRF
jgi:hypothetical protein